MRKILIITGAGLLFMFWPLLLIYQDFLHKSSAEFVELSFNDLQGWSSDRQGLALLAFNKSCELLLNRPASTVISPRKLGGVAGDWHQPCEKARTVGSDSDLMARKFFEAEFIPLAYGAADPGLFTGYFAPEYAGSRVETEEFRYPLYQIPPDLKRLDLGQFSRELAGKTIIGEVKDGDFIPYKARDIIDQGAFKDQGLELVWLQDPSDAFFMHIQGSGIIHFEDGTRQLFGYAGKNGKEYHSIGKFLIRNGDVAREDMSMQAIRHWITANPEQARPMMWRNPSYVFFRPLSQSAPVGAMTVELTEGRSLAVDLNYVPLGMPLWLDLQPASEEGQPLQRLAIAQDTGGAIKGRVRADIYWGIGDLAGQKAGPMKERGTYYFLVPRALAKKILAYKILQPLSGKAS